MKTRKELIYENLNTEEKIVFNEFEVPIYDYLHDLDQRGFLNFEYEREEAKKVVSFFKSLYTLTKFYNDLIVNQEELTTHTGIDLKDVPYLGAHLYQIFSEKLKLSFLFFIQIDKMKLGKDPSLGGMIGRFKKMYPRNKFILELSSQTRNSVAHYSYYFEGDLICFCKSYFDNNPRCIEYNNFEKELKRLNIIVELFIATFFDDFKANWINDINVNSIF